MSHICHIKMDSLGVSTDFPADSANVKASAPIAEEFTTTQINR